MTPSPVAPGIPAENNPDSLRQVPPIPRGVGLFVALLSAIVLLSSLVGIGAGVLNTPPVWFMVGFEVVILVAAVFGVLLALGRFADGPALGLTCVAGAIGMGSLLGWFAGQENLGMDLKPFLMARIAATVAIIGSAGFIVLIRRPGASWPRLAAGLGCSAAFAGLAGAAWKGANALGSLGVLAGALIGVIGTVVMLGLLAAAVHLLVAAFESGSIEAPDATSAKSE